MSTTNSNTFTIETRAAASTTPLWLQGKAVNEWVPIPGTAMGSMDVTKLVTAGLCLPNRADNGHASPTVAGALLYFGGTLREADSSLLVFGGGGARAWAGNEVRVLKLSDDAPQWKVHNTPSDASQIWFNTYKNTLTLQPPWDGTGEQYPSPSTPYMRDGVSPNARHAYNGPIFHDGLDRFYLFGCQNVWQTDSGDFRNVDSLDWATQAWSAPGTHLQIPFTVPIDAHWIKKHPVTEKVYTSNTTTISEYDPDANTWTQVYHNGALNNLSRRTVCIDPVENLLWTLAEDPTGGNTAPTTMSRTLTIYDMNTNPWTAIAGTLTGSHAASITTFKNTSGDFYSPAWGAGMVYDTQNACFMWFQDDSQLYKISRVSDSTWNVDQVPTTGAGPTPRSGSFVGNCFIWGRMQYVPALKGVVMQLPGTVPGPGSASVSGALVSTYPVYFIKTAA